MRVTHDEQFKFIYTLGWGDPYGCPKSGMIETEVPLCGIFYLREWRG